MTPFVLLFLGLLLLFIEFYVPGGVIGIEGGMMIFTSLIWFGFQSASGTETLLFFLAAMLGIVGTIFLALWAIRRTKKTGSVYLESDQEGYRAASYDPSLIGKVGAAHTDLRPGGFVIIEGKRYSAVSLAGFVPRGAEVEVLAVEGETIKVKQKGT